MNVESQIDPHRADELARKLEGLVTAAEPALQEEEIETVNEAIEFIEEAGGIETGRVWMESPTTGASYRVTRWIDLGDDKIVALSKTEVDDPQDGESA